MLRFGPAHGPIVVVAMPLFEEANRTRTFVVGLCRHLAGRGIASVLPDLPGTGESLVETCDARLADWCAAFGALITELAATRAVHVAAIRSGALVDGSFRPTSRWYFAPVDGEELVRGLLRVRLIAGGAGDIDPPGQPVEFGGNLISRGMIGALRVATLCDAGRTVRIDSDPRAADVKLPGAALWRRSEPGDDPALAALLADDIAGWIATCAG